MLMLGKPSRWFAPLAATAALLLAASPAGATVTRPPNPPDFVVPADLACGFDLGVSGTGGKITRIDFKNGNFFQVGKGVILTYTNLSNGKTYRVNTAGTVARFTQNPDGKTWTFSAAGHFGFIFFPTDAPGAGAFQYTGQLKLTIDSPSTVNVLSVDSSGGKAVDICARLR